MEYTTMTKPRTRRPAPPEPPSDPASELAIDRDTLLEIAGGDGEKMRILQRIAHRHTGEYLRWLDESGAVEWLAAHPDADYQAMAAELQTRIPPGLQEREREHYQAALAWEREHRPPWVAPEEP